MNDGSFPLFKGCTRPATFLGVPLAPFFIVNGVLLWIGVATPWKLFMVLVIPATFVMRVIAKDDPYRFRQWGLALQLFASTFAAKRFWGGCVSLVPTNAGRRRSRALWLLAPPEWLREKKRGDGSNPLTADSGSAGSAAASPEALSESEDDDAIFAVLAAAEDAGRQQA